jgi:hypothetical protein
MQRMCHTWSTLATPYPTRCGSDGHLAGIDPGADAREPTFEDRRVVGLGRRGRVIAVDLGQPVCREEPFVRRKAAAFTRCHEPDESRRLKSGSVRGSG